MSGICTNLKCKPHIINGPDDHAHVLASMSTTIALADFLEKLKANSWANEQHLGHCFAWQPGYSAFSVSRSNFQAVYNYIATQEEHHRKWTFKQELVALLKRHGIQYDERYIWK